MQYRLHLTRKGPCNPKSVNSAIMCCARSASLWLISLDTRQQVFFQPGTALLKPLEFRPGLAALEELDNLAILVTKRVEVRVCRYQPAHSLFILREPCQQ
jgi:hypothetical protein